MSLLKVKRYVTVNNLHTTPFRSHCSYTRNMTVSRTTLFKLPNDADIEAVLAAYVKLAETNSKVSSESPGEHMVHMREKLMLSKRMANHTFSQATPLNFCPILVPKAIRSRPKQRSPASKT